MTTTIYQKFISRYAETFTLIDMTDGKDYIHSEIVPAAIVAKLSEEEFDDLFNELMDSRNEKASWSDGEDEFDEEDARAAYNQKWDEIDSAMNNAGM
jgi:predicted 3-demethylubiquinone-9 3-methyltransferase (glyoxalase superfamily)